MKGRAGGIEADRRQIVFDPEFDAHAPVTNEGITCRGQRAFDPLRGGLGVIDARFPAGGVDRDGDIGREPIGPRQFAGALVQLRQMHRPKCSDADQDARWPAQGEVGAPNVWPAAMDGHAAGDHARPRRSRPVVASASTWRSSPGVQIRKISSASMAQDATLKMQESARNDPGAHVLQTFSGEGPAVRSGFDNALRPCP